MSMQLAQPGQPYAIATAPPWASIARAVRTFVLLPVVGTSTGVALAVAHCSCTGRTATLNTPESRVASRRRGLGQ